MKPVGSSKRFVGELLVPAPTFRLHSIHYDQRKTARCETPPINTPVEGRLLCLQVDGGTSARKRSSDLSGRWVDVKPQVAVEYGHTKISRLRTCVTP